MSTFFRYALGLCLLFSACHTDDSVEASGPAAGFSGTLPGDLSINPTTVTSIQGLVSSANSVDGSFVSHYLETRDTSGVGIALELPYVQYSEAYAARDSAEVAQAAAEYYSYGLVKDQLSVGEKPILASPADDPTSSFAVHVTDNRRYFSYTAYGAEQSGSYLRVRELIEGVETDPVRGDVRTLVAVIDLRVNVSLNVDNGYGPPERLEGTLRLKYDDR